MKVSRKLETDITMDTTDSQSDKNTVRTELTVEKIISNGCGLARYSGRAVFIPYTVPGERIIAEIDLSGKKYLEGRLLDIVEASPERVSPVCPLYTVCGGCSLQHMDYSMQLRIKKDLVAEAFLRNGKTEIPCPEIIHGSPWGYRCRIQLHPSEKGGYGFRERNSSRVVPVENCPVCNAGINSFLSSGSKDIKERTVVFSPEDGRIFFSSEKNSTVKVRLGNIDISTDPGSFFQSNIPLFEKVLSEMEKHACGNILLDLYAGASVFGIFLAEKFRVSVSVEENSRAVECGRKNIPERPGFKSFFYPVSVEKYVKKYSGKFSPDTVIADPPRTGLSKQVRNYLKEISPETFIYLSCDYATMGRDIGDLSECYNLDMVKIYDFYPQTAHAETLAVLTRKK